MNSAYFNSDILPTIIKLINQAKFRLQIAVCWFTHDEIFSCLKKLISSNNALSIELIITYDSINFSEGGLNFGELLDTGLQLFVYTNNGLMHNKFFIIDNEILINGSYNWTHRASGQNFENITVAEDVGLILKYNEEFNLVKSHCHRINSRLELDSYIKGFIPPIKVYELISPIANKVIPDPTPFSRVIRKPTPNRTVKNSTPYSFLPSETKPVIKFSRKTDYFNKYLPFQIRLVETNYTYYYSIFSIDELPYKYEKKFKCHEQNFNPILLEIYSIPLRRNIISIPIEIKNVLSRNSEIVYFKLQIPRGNIAMIELFNYSNEKNIYESINFFKLTQG